MRLLIYFLLSIFSLRAAAGNPNYHVAILLDFAGEYVHDKSWNWSGPFSCPASSLTSAQQKTVIDRVKADLAGFNCLVTTDSVLWATYQYKSHCIISHGLQSQFGTGIGGISYIGTAFWDYSAYVDGRPDPAFVFEDLLSYNVNNIADATTHEIGHTLGLYHKSVFKSTPDTCTITAQYYSGTGSGSLSWAPIMGVAYSRNVKTWYTGKANAYDPVTGNCAYMQNDNIDIGLGEQVTLPGSGTGWLLDDAGNSIRAAKLITATKTGILEIPSDVDFFRLRTKGKVPTVGLTAYQTADFAIDIYDVTGSLIVTLDDPTNIGVTDAVVTTSSPIIYLKVKVSTAVSTLPKTDTRGMYKLNIQLN